VCGDNVEAAIGWLLTKQAQQTNEADAKNVEERKRSSAADDIRQRNKEEFEKRRAEAARIRQEKLAAKRNIRPPVLHYGDWIAFQSLKTHQFVSSRPGQTSVHSDAAAVTQDSEVFL